jgi:hypothetical protein
MNRHNKEANMGSIVFSVPNVVINYPLTTAGRLQTFSQACEIALQNGVRPGMKVGLPLSQETIGLLPRLNQDQYLRAGFFIAFGHWLRHQGAKVVPLVSKESSHESVAYLQLATLIRPDGTLPDLGRVIEDIREAVRKKVDFQQQVPFLKDKMTRDQAWSLFAKEESLEELEAAHLLSSKPGFSVAELPAQWARFRRQTVAAEVAAKKRLHKPKMVFIEKEIAGYLGCHDFPLSSGPLGDPFPVLRWLYGQEQG